MMKSDDPDVKVSPRPSFGRNALASSAKDLLIPALTTSGAEISPVRISLVDLESTKRPHAWI
jgi:hypothetical protein